MLKDINVDPETLWQKGSKTFNHIARKIKSDFWKKVFESAVAYTEIESQQNTEFILNQNLSLVVFSFAYFMKSALLSLKWECANA